MSKEQNSNEMVVTTVAEYVQAVCSENQQIKARGMKGLRILFRGQADADNLLLPSLGRITSEGKSIIEEERNMIEMARYKLPSVFRKDLEPLELLALLQHHGIPTRLLDVSENALVGLYFACHDNELTRSKDGEVILFQTDDINVSNYPVANKIAACYQSNEPVINDSDDILFVYAPSYSLRQNIQRGRYILFSDTVEDGKRMIHPIGKNHHNILKRIIIPAKHKKQIRRDLRLLGVSKELLFLDNTDMVCKEIAERFSEIR